MCISGSKISDVHTLFISTKLMRKKILLYILLFSSISIFSQTRDSKENEYTDGVFFVNEDWYGHQNSTVNFLSNGGEWTYRVFQKENVGKELGCTTQYGAIYGGKFFFVSKQDQDPGASIRGSRLAICDAKTMKVIKEFTTIAVDDKGRSAADGRSFLGVNEHKGYIGTSNGVWVLDLDKMQIKGQIAGTGNPNASGYGQLYYAQVGTMVRTEDYVFAVHQQDGLKVIDPNEDVVIKTIAPPKFLDTKGAEKSRGFGSIVQAKDGSLLISMASDTQGMGGTLSYFLKMNPYTFTVDTIQIPKSEGIEDIPNSWYAWTADGFCASTQENKIYWSGNNGNSWFKGRRIFSYDLDTKQFSKVFDFEAMPNDWILYGAGFRLHPVSDELYCSLFHAFQDPTYQSVRISSDGKLLQEYSMITNYWFPAMPVFPDVYDPIVEDIKDITCGNTEPFVLSLKGLASDADNMEVSIVKSVLSNTASNIYSAEVFNGNLTITPQAGAKGEGVVKIRFNSNGKVIDKDVKVKVLDKTSGIEDGSLNDRLIYMDRKDLVINNCEGYSFSIYNMNGQFVQLINVQDITHREYLNLSNGVYILKGNKGSDVINKKIIVK